jgi:general secretion pathway protein F
MPLYEYKGINSNGKSITNTVDAENVRAARAKVKREGIFITEIRDKQRAAAKKNSSRKGGSGGKVSIGDLAMMTRQLASLIKANIPLVEALAAVSDQVENQTLKEAVADIKNMVNEGLSLHKGLAKYPKIFDHIFVTMCEAGEASGTLDHILMRLAEFKEAQYELNRKISSAITYPVVMLVFTLGMLGVLFIFVVPQMQAVFESMELELPWYTQVVVGASGFLVSYWYVLIGLAIGGYSFFQVWKKTPEGSKTWDATVLQIPLIGKLARMVAVSRFTRTLATLLQGGVPMLNALSIVRNIVGNHVLATAIDQARDNISEGESIAAPLKKSGQFPPLVIHMINIGEKTGELENMLTQVSDSYDFEVKNRVQGLTSLLEPVMIIFMGLTIGVIVFAIMIPMFKMAQLGSQ